MNKCQMLFWLNWIKLQDIEIDRQVTSLTWAANFWRTISGGSEAKLPLNHFVFIFLTWTELKHFKILPPKAYSSQIILKPEQRTSSFNSFIEREDISSTASRGKINGITQQEHDLLVKRQLFWPVVHHLGRNNLIGSSAPGLQLELLTRRKHLWVKL